MSHPLWTLYNSVTEQTIENLDVPGAVASLSTYSIEELAVWFAWHEGLSDWKPILELPEFAGQFTPPAPAKPALSLVAEPVPVAPAPTESLPAAPQPAAPQPAAPAPATWEPEAFPKDVSEKTAFGYSATPQQDEITRTVEVTVTNFEVTEVTEVTAIAPTPQPQPQPAAPAAAAAPAAPAYAAPTFEVPAAAWTAPQPAAPQPAAPQPAAPVSEQAPVEESPSYEEFEATQVPAMSTPQPVAPQPVAPQPAAPAPVAAAPVEPTPAPHAAPQEDTNQVFWMTEGPDGQMQPAVLDEMTGSHVHTGAAPVVLSEESEHLAAQAESMPEHGDSIVAKVGTPSRQASFPLASGSAPGGTPASSASNSSGADRRKYPRFDIRYRVIVRNDNLTFRTFSRNISLGGVALEMPVPEALLGSECQIYVGNPRTGENIRFSGKLVANRNDSQFFVFLKSSPDSLTKLQKWVETHQSTGKRAG